MYDQLFANNMPSSLGLSAIEWMRILSLSFCKTFDSHNFCNEALLCWTRRVKMYFKPVSKTKITKMHTNIPNIP